MSEYRLGICYLISNDKIKLNGLFCYLNKTVQNKQKQKSVSFGTDKFAVISYEYLIIRNERNDDHNNL